MVPVGAARQRLRPDVATDEITTRIKQRRNRIELRGQEVRAARTERGSNLPHRIRQITANQCGTRRRCGLSRVLASFS